MKCSGYRTGRFDCYVKRSRGLPLFWSGPGRPSPPCPRRVGAGYRSPVPRRQLEQLLLRQRCGAAYQEAPLLVCCCCCCSLCGVCWWWQPLMSRRGRQSCPTHRLRLQQRHNQNSETSPLHNSCKRQYVCGGGSFALPQAINRTPSPTPTPHHTNTRTNSNSNSNNNSSSHTNTNTNTNTSHARLLGRHLYAYLPGTIQPVRFHHHTICKRNCRSVEGEASPCPKQYTEHQHQ